MEPSRDDLSGLGSPLRGQTDEMRRAAELAFGGIPQNRIKARHGDESDYSADWDEDSPDKQAGHALALKRDMESKRAVKLAMESRLSGGKSANATPDLEMDDEQRDGSNWELDNLWARIRDFFNEAPPAKVKGADSNRLRLLNACITRDPQGKGVITKRDLQAAFTAARAPFLTDDECDQLISALDAWDQRIAQTVVYRRFLEAPHARGVVSLHGIFPRLQARGPSKYELERKAKAEEEERLKAVAIEEERKRREIQQARKRPVSSKEDARKTQKEDQAKKEAEKREAEGRKKAEDEAVAAEVRLAKAVVQRIRLRVGKGVRKWFGLAGADQLDQESLAEVLVQAGSIVGVKDLEAIFQMLDHKGRGRISAREFCDVMEGKTSLNYTEIVTKQRAQRQQEGDLRLGRAINAKSREAEFGSSAQDTVGQVDGLSSIMGRSSKENKVPPKLMDDESDQLRVNAEIKELLRHNNGKRTGFDDLLQMMGKPGFQREGQVTLQDFQAVIRGAGGQGKFSAHEVKRVFNSHAQQPQPGVVGAEPFMPLREFKDKFLPGLSWTRDGDEATQVQNTDRSGKSQGEVSESKTESMFIDNILDGKKLGDVLREREEEERLLEKRMAKNKPADLQEVHEQSFEGLSQDSRVSRAIDDLVETKWGDPRKKNAQKQIAAASSTKGGAGRLNEEALNSLNNQQMTNQTYYRQPEAIMREGPSQLNLAFDKTLDKFFKAFCEALVLEANSGPKPREIQSYVDHYGKEASGFLSYAEFKEIHVTHVQALDRSVQPPEEAKLIALFNLFDVQSRGKVAKQDFVATINRLKPSIALIERLANKVRKGGERLIRALTEEFQEADAPFGCNGNLPLNNFQVILADYDLPLLESDLTDLEKRGYVCKDGTDGKYVDYIGVLSQVRPKNLTGAQQANLMLRAIVRIQSVWRGKQARREHAARRRAAGLLGADEVGDVIEALRNNDPAQLAKATKGQKTEPKKEKEVKKSARTADQLEAKMAPAIRADKGGKVSDKALQARKEMSEFLRKTVLEHCIEAAFCYGESLEVCRTIQKRFENRPVTKYLFPMLQEFQFGVQGVLPKSLANVNALGQVMVLDDSNQLNQYDIATVRSLQSVNLGTRPPLKHYQIIDMVCDQASGRIYTLNANWILEIWNIEQGACFPQKRLAVCANEGGKEFINLYYTATFSNSKPRFLSLQQSNQQILLVNTTCVDGSIVFIDPISFSVLKKIQLKYSDYEIPKIIKDSIRKLQSIFDDIGKNQGTDVGKIFADITHRDTQEVKIRDFVAKLVRLDPKLVEDDLFKTCRVLDADGSGTITLDEFLEFFGNLNAEEQDLLKGAEELEDKIWPEWLIKEGKLAYAQGLLTSMHSVLENDHGITAEQAFGIYDMKDCGECSPDEFKRVLRIFFGEVLPEPEVALEFLMRMTQQRANKKIAYREFCKFLSKRVVRTFQGASSGPETDGAAKGNVQRELERPLIKEACLAYVLRKSAELGLDLRKIIAENDKNGLNVIPRSKFVCLLLDLPLGINEVEVAEILENDLHFDNYGNVDYNVILNSDLFVHLERDRLKKTHKKRRGVVLDGHAAEEEPEAGGEKQADKIDNRKVVVEDLIYIDDLEILIYTTVAPKTSSVFITSTKKSPEQNGGATANKNEVKVISLDEIGGQKKDKKEEPEARQSASLELNYFQLLAKLKGHKNSDPPSICYVPHSCCLITGEKYLDEAEYAAPKGSFPATSDPTVPSSHKFQKSGQTAYEKHNSRGQPCEILIWNLQRDLIELFQSRPPWNVPCHKRILAHNSSIVDICYLTKSQLVVTASTDQTIKFFDPVSTSYELTDPSNNPHAMMRPGHYKPLQREQTRTNITMKEVKRVYTGNDTSCFALRCLSLPNIAADPQNPEIKSQIEWLVALKLGKPQWQQGRNTQIGFICGYGIERVQIEVPALHHDDIVPPFILKECEELITARRRKLVSVFQQNLQQTIQKIFSQGQLQDSYIAKVRSLFMQAILQRKELKYVNPEPLREIYNLILKLPDRTKFQSFLASSGCSDKLSVSETFFYLQKFQQIQPLRTTQIEFERSIQEFHDKHQRQFLKGIKRWPKESVKRFADHLRQNGLELAFLQTGNNAGVSFTSFCTRERFVQYFQEVVHPLGNYFSDLEIDSILNDLDPFYTGVIQLRLLQKVYQEEIQYFRRTSLSRPNEILEDIRTIIFPNKRVALQQALASADTEGDGYLKKDQFLLAFQQAGVNMDREILEFLFDVMSESFTLPKTEFEPKHSESAVESEKVIQLVFFMGKLFRSHETRETDEVEAALSNIKAALVYKGLDFSIIFAEEQEENTKKPRRQAAKRTKEEKQQQEEERKLAAQKKEQSVDMTMHYQRFAQQIDKQNFCRRVESLNAPHVTPEKIQRLATFLALNQKNKTVVYLNSWLHHLRRANTAFQEADKKVLPLICSKLLRNERVFRSWLESCGRIKGSRDEEKFIQLADLRQVLTKFGVSYINQGMFIKEFTKGDQVHIEDLIARVKSVASKHYQMAGSSAHGEDFEPHSLAELRKTDYFSQIHQEIRTTGTVIDNQELLRQFKTFDGARTGVIKVYLLINVLKHNYPKIFSESCLLGLQFQLECLSADGTVDYAEFIQIFFEDAAKAKAQDEIKLDRKSPYNLHDYEDLLSKINSHVKEQGLDLMRIFDIFGKQGGFITFQDLGKILDLIEFVHTDHQFELIKRYADESNQGTIHAYELVNQILSSEKIAPSFDIYRWIVASRELMGRYRLLETVQSVIDSIKDQMITRYGDPDGKHCGVLMAANFADLLGAELSSLSESEKHLLCLFAVKGSRRIHGGDQPTSARVDLKTDLVQFYHFEKALEEVIQHMRKEAIAKQNLAGEAQSDSLTKFRQQTDQEMQRQQKIDDEHFGSAQSRGMQALKGTVVAIFQERDISFYDCFQSLYDPLNPKASIISISEFKKRVRQLNLPLSVQDHRLLRRIADPKQIGKVDIQKFCSFFETADLRQRRLNKILDKVATAFFLQGFNMRRAFALFDADGDGAISAKEFRQGMAALNLHLRYDEIDDLMHLCDQDNCGAVSYDEFISRMDLSIKNRTGQVMEKVEEAFFEKLGLAMEYSRETLYDIMQDYDFDSDGTIDVQDLPKVIKKLGIMNPDPHIHHVLRAGRCGPNDKRIDYTDFSINLEAEITKRKRQASSVYERQLQKISALLKNKGLSVFQFFVNLDVNQSGGVSRLELKTGIQQLGLHITSQEFDSLWNAIYKPVDQIHHESPADLRIGKKGRRLEPDVEQATYPGFISTFAEAGCVKLQKAVDNREALLGKFRTQMKKMRISVEKAYKAFDPNNYGSVQRKDFTHDCLVLGLQFSEEELGKIFEVICEYGTKQTTSNDQQIQQLDRAKPTAYTRFNYKQLQEAIIGQRDENWLFQSCIKIHSVSLQKGLSYKRLFTQWRDKSSKAGAGRLCEKELAQGLKRMKAGLTTEDIEKLCSSLPYEGKDIAISAVAFEKFVIDGARKLETEKSYQKMILQEWISQFNDCLQRGGAPIERVFYENDTNQSGSLGFEDFSNLNQNLGLVVARKDLQSVFNIIDRNKSKRVRLEDLKSISSLVHRDDDQNQDSLAQQDECGLAGLTGEELIRRQELNDIYAKVKETLENLNLTLEVIVYNDLKYMPKQLITSKGVQQIFERLEIILTKGEAERMLIDIRKANNGAFEASFKTFIDFMTRKRINVAFVDKGFIDPLIAQCCQMLAKAKDSCAITYDQLFNLFVGKKSGQLSKDNFLLCVQGLELEISIEDLLELFNYMDERGSNQISKIQFVDALTYVTNKLGGQSFLDSAMSKGSQAKKNTTNRQSILNILNNVADSIHQKSLQMRQVIQLIDANKTGFISRAEFSQIIRGLCETITLDQTRLMLTFFDERSTGKISVAELVAILQDLINQQIGGGVYAFMQVQPVIQQIINQLAIDADKFFDEVAYKNDALLKEEGSSDQYCGLSKRLFFGQLADYGVSLSEQDKALICQVFGIEGVHDKLDYLKLDQAFEGEQQHLYALEEFYTVEWERRVWKKIGEYLKRHNHTIQHCFDLIDDDGSQTISLTELKQALIRFDLRLTDKQVLIFLERLAEPGKGYISREAFIKRFWSAFTYDSIVNSSAEEQVQQSSMLPEGSHAAADRGRIASGLQQKLKGLKMLKAIQECIKKTMTVSDAFKALDSGVGFITLQDFSAGLGSHFDLTLKQNELRALFLEVDSDGNGIVKYGEFDAFYRMNYDERVKELETEREQMVTQYDIFDHLLKVLRQKGLSLEEMFDQIDLDKNQFIEVDEFHQTLECMGFLITEEQVFELMRQMDDNFDGRISYNELKQHILSLGFQVDKTLESKNPEGPSQQMTTFNWRDKGLELIIQSLHKKLNGKTYEDYLTEFDHDHDGHLTPSEFRQALLALREGQLSRPQIERVLHILLEEKKSQPLVSIERMVNFLRGYSSADEEISKGTLLIDEDLFVYIVERYDGFSRLVEQFAAVEERAQYISRHTHEINLRGLDMLANQMNLEKIHRRAQAINGLYESTLVLLAGEANRLIRDEAQLCVLDPTFSINTIVDDSKVGALSAVSVPPVENSTLDIDGASLVLLPSGAQRFEGVMGKQRRKVEVLMYPNDCLNYPSEDRKAYRKHLQLELQVHRFLMGANYDVEEELDPLGMDIFPNIGKRERRVGPAAGDTEVQVVNELIDGDEWINLDDFVFKNGGILNIPLFYHTDAPLFIIRHWAKMILKIIQKVHDVSVVLRCLNLKQVWVSRDGQRIKLGHVRGVGKVDNFGYISTCSDIFLNLDNNVEDPRAGQSSRQSAGPKIGGAASSSKKTDGVRQFSNSCLDSPFIAPETLCLKYQDQSAALDVWSFGMIMYCLLLGRKPQSFYSVYRAWYKKFHGHDVEMAALPPFLPPSSSNFLYDPFAIDFENPFDSADDSWSSSGLDIEGSLKEKQGSMNFENFIKCLKGMSYSSLFTQENSKKFHFQTIDKQIEQTGGLQPPRFAGQEVTSQETRLRLMQTLAKGTVLARKNELGLILDLISSCLDMDPKRRPTVPGLLNSPLFQLDTFEMTKAVRFSQNVILYRSPQSTVTMRITGPLRGICAHAIKQPERLINIEEDILKMFAGVEECVAHISSLPLDEINQVLTEEERRRALLDPRRAAIFKGKDSSRLRVSPNSPLAAQIIEDRVVDMLIFLAFRFTKALSQWKQKIANADTESSQSPSKMQGGAASQTEGTRRSKSVRFGDGATERASSQTQQALLKGQTKRLQNHVLQRMTRLLKTLVYEMHSYSTPMAPFVKEVVEYVVKFYAGEEYELGSDCVLRRTSGSDNSLQDYLRGRSFFQKEVNLSEKFKADQADKAWHLEQRNQSFLDKSNHWSLELHSEANKIYKDAITESGMGQSCYPVLNDYISNVSNSFEPSKIFSKQMNQLSLSFLIPMNRTTAYYNELIPITECLSRLYSPDLEKAGKRCALAMIRSVFQTGSSDKIKACLDMRVPKHIIHFLQDSDSEVRKECLLTLLEISKGLQDEDFEIMGKTAANLKQEYSRRGFRKTAFDQHKAISMASQSEAVEEADQDVPMVDTKSKQKIPQANADGYSTYIKRTIALIEKNENERFINFALDLPNLNFLASKRFLKEMAVCFESPVFIAPLTRLLKQQTETFQNKEVILQIMENLFCGNEKVLTALNSPASDTYMTLLRLLMVNTKTQNARANPSGLPATMRNHLQLQDTAVELFRFMFEQRRPTIIRDLGCIGASCTLLREQGLRIPELISLPDIVAFFDDFSQMNDDLKADMIHVDDFILVIKDLRCWVKHFYDQSSIPELTRIKALQRCCSFLIKVVGLVWDEYKTATPERKLESLMLIKISLQLFDWLCIKGKQTFLFNEECGRANLRFLLERCNMALSSFRAPQEDTQLPLEDLTFDKKKNKESQSKRKYDMFPFTEIGAILQNILYQLVRKDSRYINQLLSEANFGFIFGEQLLLEYDFIRHCIDNKIESLVLIDSYVKKNEIRLNTFEYLLRSSESTLKDQLLTSSFIDKLFEDYITDFREFNIQFSKIDLEFLAFRRSYPVRLECISLVNTCLMLKSSAPRVFTELVTYARRHFLIKQELDLLRRGRFGNKESTALLLFSIILESNEEDLIHALMQEGAPEILRQLIRDHPSLGRKFPILAAFTSPF